MTIRNDPPQRARSYHLDLLIRGLRGPVTMLLCGGGAELCAYQSWPVWLVITMATIGITTWAADEGKRHFSDYLALSRGVIDLDRFRARARAEEGIADAAEASRSLLLRAEQELLVGGRSAKGTAKVSAALRELHVAVSHETPHDERSLTI